MRKGFASVRFGLVTVRTCVLTLANCTYTISVKYLSNNDDTLPKGINDDRYKASRVDGPFTNTCHCALYTDI